MLFPVALLLEIAVDPHTRELLQLLRVPAVVLGVSVIFVFEIVLANPRAEKRCRQNMRIRLLGTIAIPLAKAGIQSRLLIESKRKFWHAEVSLQGLAPQALKKNR